MMLLTVPVFYPVMQALGFDLVWFGIVVVVVIEISLITPPIGLNVFVLKSMLPDIEPTKFSVACCHSSLRISSGSR